MPELNECFVKLIEDNIKNRKQSVLFLNNSNTINLNGRDLDVKYYDDILKVYRNDNLKYIIDINSIIAVVTK